MSDVLVRQVGRAMRITLNRPDSLNSLTLEMVRAVDRALTVAESDDAIAVVVIDGAGDRALCAGGDIRNFYVAAIHGDTAPLTFWREEYLLNLRIARFAKPIVPIMDGLVLGGGVGISAHASHRVATDRASIGMPEVAIGFVPDVGGTWLLSRAPGEFGSYMALTAGRVGATDAIAAGLADYLVRAERVPQLVDLLSVDDVDVAIARLAEEPVAAATDLMPQSSWIDEAFAPDSVQEILGRLSASENPVAQKAATTIAAHSPTALDVTLRALRVARQRPSLESCIAAEYQISRTFLLSVPDFVEGIRAAVIDKDRSPKWNPERLDEVDPKVIEACFAEAEEEAFGAPQP